MIKVDLSKLIDDRNELLWIDLNKSRDIYVKFHDEPYYGVYQINKTSTIYIPKQSYSKDSFTHELLHVLMTTKNIYIGYPLDTYPVLKKQLYPNLVEHIGNTLQHVKMLPLYLDMGFQKDLFLSDYNDAKFTINDELFLRKKFCIKSWFGIKFYSKNAINHYIGKYFAIKACPNETFDYTGSLSVLKKLDSSLFKILDEFYNKWVEYDIDKPNYPAGYFPFEHKLGTDLEKWFKNKVITR